jgi:hypothetical protein
VDGTSIEETSHVSQRMPKGPERTPVNKRFAGGRGVEAEEHSHCRRLAGTVRPQEAGDPAGQDVEGEVIDGPHASVPLGQ